MKTKIYPVLISKTLTHDLPPDFWQAVIVGAVAGFVVTMVVVWFRKRRRKKLAKAK